MQTYKWAYKDCSDAAIASVHALYEINQIPLNYLLDVLARAVESDPCNKVHWYQLVNILSATKSLLATKVCSLQCEVSTGEEDDGESWCQKYRLKWEDDFFHSPPHSTLMVKPEFVTMVLDAIDFEFSAASGMCVDDRPENSQLAKGQAFTSSLQCCLDWIWTSSYDDTLQEGLSSGLVDSTLLPTHAPKVTKTRNDFLDKNLSLKMTQDKLCNDPTCEALCLRVFVAYHMFGDCDFVWNSIWWLAVKHWKANQQSHSSNVYYVGLNWLNLQGINIRKNLEKKRTQK